jgi:hypothetical protein
MISYRVVTDYMTGAEIAALAGLDTHDVIFFIAQHDHVKPTSVQAEARDAKAAARTEAHLAKDPMGDSK